jgi:hypothetical protein
MNNQEAKFILGAYRSDGQDAGDPIFADALAQAARDPELGAWLERQRKFDTALAGKLRDIIPPAELRAAILAGGRASQPRRRWWRNPLWLAAAAVIAVAAIVNVSISPASSRHDASALATFALTDLEKAHDQHVGYPAGFETLQAALGSAQLPLTSELGRYVDLDELRRKNCRSVRVAGRDVFEICFQRNGTWFHLFAAERTNQSRDSGGGKPLIMSQGEYTAAAWSDSQRVYALVAASSEALRRLI